MDLQFPEHHNKIGHFTRACKILFANSDTTVWQTVLETYCHGCH